MARPKTGDRGTRTDPRARTSARSAAGRAASAGERTAAASRRRPPGKQQPRKAASTKKAAPASSSKKVTPAKRPAPASARRASTETAAPAKKAAPKRRAAAGDRRSKAGAVRPANRNSRAQRSSRRPPQRSPKKQPPPRKLRLADPRKRLRVVLVGFCVLMSLFGGRLVQLQGIDASSYAAAAREVGRETESLPAARGEIVDRNGNPLASTVDSFDVVVDQTLVANPAQYALELERFLDVEASDLQDLLTGDRRFVYLAKDVTGSIWRQVEELELDGLYAELVPTRTYPAGSVGGNLLGFIGENGEGERVGLAGFEAGYEKALAGTDGEAVYQMSPNGQRIPTDPGTSVSQPEAGTDYRLTLDTDLQWFVESALRDAVINADADYGVATVLDAKTAEVLAMASTPVVDPNEPGKVDPEDRKNKAVENSFEPGSVFKPLTMAAVIEEGMAGPETVFNVPDAIERSGATIHDYWGHADLTMTLTEILAKSSNVGTLLAAESISHEAHRDYLDAFGVGSRPGLNLPAETGGLLPKLDDWSQLTQDTVAFGQGVAVSSAQLASAIATIANGGVRVPPTLVQETISPGGDVTPTAQPDASRVVSEQTADTVTDMMEAVMGPDGTGSPADVEGYRVAGKTGTAQRVDPDCGCYQGYNSSFTGFAPANDPKYVVVVSMINPSNGNSGGALAGPAFSEIMEFALQQAGIPPSKKSDE